MASLVALLTDAFLAAAGAMVLSLALTPAVRGVARRLRWLDHPDGDRKLHPVAVPRAGGVAVYFAFVLAVAACGAFGGAPAESHLPLVAAAGAVLLVGLLDDVRGATATAKLTVQTAAAAFLYWQGYRIDTLTNPFGDAFSLGALSFPITVLWLVGMSNAFNLIDGLDGLASGVALFATVSLCVAGVVNGREDAVILIAALAGALLGFLPYNFTPATIFLGDGGSLFIGFALAGLALGSSIKASAALAVATPLLALALPIVDVQLAIVRRLARGQPIFRGDRDHIHHRLLAMGFTPRRSVMILYAVAAVYSALSLLTAFGKGQVLNLLIMLALLIAWAGVRRLGYAELGGRAPAAPPTPALPLGSKAPPAVARR